MEITQQEAQVIVNALDKLGVALSAHNHEWTDEERLLYEEAIGTLTLGLLLRFSVIG